MVGWSDLKNHIGVSDDSEDERLQAIFTGAKALVDTAVQDAFRTVPDEILDLMYLEVGATLWDRRNAPANNSQFAVFDGGALPVRQPRDPLATIRPIIAKYVVPF